MRASLLPLAGLAAALAAAPLTTQTLVSGRLLDAGSGAAIAEGTVVLSSARGGWRATARADTSGYFEFAGVAAGTYRLHASRLGYREVAGELRLAPDSVVSVEVRMAARSVVLQPVTVVTRSQRRMSPVLRAFYDRMQRGPGRFITREEIESRHASRVSEVLRTLPNIRASTSRMGMGGSTLSHGSSAGRCSLVFFVDGMRMNQPPPPGGRGGMDFVIDDYVSPGDVEGIEVYRGESETPAEFVTAAVSCGTVVIWTKRGPD